MTDETEQSLAKRKAEGLVSKTKTAIEDVNNPQKAKASVPKPFKWRNWGGAVLSAAAIVAGSVALVLIKMRLPPMVDVHLISANPELVYYAYMVFAAHAVVTVSAIWWAYQLLRLSERLLIPRDLANSAQDLLGVKPTPKIVEKMQDAAVKRFER